MLCCRRIQRQVDADVPPSGHTDHIRTPCEVLVEDECASRKLRALPYEASSRVARDEARWAQISPTSSHSHAIESRGSFSRTLDTESHMLTSGVGDQAALRPVIKPSLPAGAFVARTYPNMTPPTQQSSAALPTYACSFLGSRP